MTSKQDILALAEREMTDDIKARLRELLAKATPGPWFTLDPPWLPGGSETSILAESPDPHVARFICDFDLWALDDDEDRKSECPDDDARLIVECVNALPDLLDHIETLEARIAELEGEKYKAFTDVLKPPHRYADRWQKRPTMTLTPSKPRLAAKPRSCWWSRISVVSRPKPAQHSIRRLAAMDKLELADYHFYQLAEQIVDSEPVITTYAAPEWRELSEDGHAWIAAIVKAVWYRPARSADCQRLLQALKEAREALAPFAREADSHDRPDIADQDRFGGDICFGDFRLARQALAKIDEAGGAG